MWSDYPEHVRRLVREPGVRRVCELGAGANPILGLDLVAEQGLEYHVVDISAEELAKAPPGYTTIQADAGAPAFAREHGPYDLVISAFLAEHLPRPQDFHAAVHAALAPGGRALHTFPTLYEPAFVLNRLLPERLTAVALRGAQEGREAEGAHAKFPAYYRWCRGPTRPQLRRLEEAGFDVLDYVGYFGHGYFSKLPRAYRLYERLSTTLVRYPVPALTSYASVLLRRR